MSDKKAVYTTGEVARICGVTLRTVINWIEKGRIESYKLPGKRGDNRITVGNLKSFLAENNFPPLEKLGTEFNSAKKVLVVEDDKQMASAIARMLKLAGYQVALAYDGFEAGVQFERFGPDIVTMDLNMPKLDGITTMTYLKEKFSVKVIVISGEGADRLNAALAAGADAVFSKPFDQREIVESINGLLGMNSAGV